MNRLLKLSIVPVLLILAACSDQDPSRKSAQDQPPPQWLLTSEPSGAKSVADTKADASEGDTVVVRGRIGGRKQPMADDSPVFTIIDLSVPHCAEIPGDNCPTPWDYCCEPAESIRANAATVQLVDEQGEALTIGPKSAGLSELDELVIVGAVGPRPSEDVLTIVATGIYRVGG